MTASSTPPSEALGFLTVLEDPQHGLLGGYLVLNRSGRPLEFHCTSPVKANRAQEILFGPTLGSYLYGEQIGQTLVAKSTLSPSLIFTNHAAALAVREFVNCPVALVEAEMPSSGATFRVDGSHPGPPTSVLCKRGGDRISTSASGPDDRQRVQECLASLAETFVLSEPFARIEAAIEEARRGGK